MTVIREEEMNMPEIIKEEPYDCSEMFDTSKQFIPAEIHASEKKLAW